MARMSDDLTLVGALLDYAPLASLPVVFVWFGLVNRRWFTPAHLSFGLPFTVMTFGCVLVPLVKVAAQPGITTTNLVVCPLAALIWLVLLFVQTFIRREYQAAPIQAQWVFLVGWANVLGLATYFLLRAMLRKAGL